MWDWSADAFRRGEVAEQPELASFVAGLIWDGPGDLDVNESILSRYRMRALPLVEWNLSPDARSLFEALRGAGGTRGYFIEYPGQKESHGGFHECDLSPNSAAIVASEDLFGSATIFIDDLFSCAIAAWFTDFTYLCMSPALFGTYLAANPILLDLHGSDTEVPADRFQAALRGAFARLDQWSVTASAVRSGLEWQLIRSTSSHGN